MNWLLVNFLRVHHFANLARIRKNHENLSPKQFLSLRYLEIWMVKTSTYSFCFYLSVVTFKFHCIKQTSVIFRFNKHLRIKGLSHAALCVIDKYFPHFSYFSVTSLYYYESTVFWSPLILSPS